MKFAATTRHTGIRSSGVALTYSVHSNAWTAPCATRLSSEKVKVEGRELQDGEEEENVVLEFDPSPPQDMLVACLWSRWTAPGEPDLLSFAAITDEPPPEIAAAGHDRCIIPIKPENVDEWLNPNPHNLQRQYEILDDRAQPYYEHRLAA